MRRGRIKFTSYSKPPKVKYICKPDKNRQASHLKPVKQRLVLSQVKPRLLNPGSASLVVQEHLRTLHYWR